MDPPSEKRCLDMTDTSAELDKLREFIQDTNINSLEPLCKLLLRLNGQPYTLDDHFPLKPLFVRRRPRQIVVKGSRQFGKTTALAALSVTMAAVIPYFRVMFVTPLKPQATNISNAYVKNFLLESPFYEYLVGPDCAKSVLYKEFRNKSRIIFLYALLSAMRTRSYSNDMLIIDEVQDFDIDHIPIIRETLTASKWRLEMFTGTPLSLDGTLEQLWQESSGCELIIKCQSCSFWNIPALDHHLERMIGPWREDISEKRPATICARCGQPISPRHGKWVARRPAEHKHRAGYHVPQIIMPMHYADVKRWRELLDKMEGKGPTPRYKFVNEVLGESYDEAAALLTSKDLAAVSTLGKNSLENAYLRRSAYNFCALSIDWGGGGKEGTSLTTVAFAGLTTSGNIEIPFGKRFVGRVSPRDEAREILHLYSDLMPTFVIHDYTNAGNVRELYLLEWGMPESKIVPIYFVGSSTNFILVPSIMPNRSRTYYRMDKTKAYQYVTTAIKENKINFFSDELDGGQKLLNDFLVLKEERTITATGRESYKIIKSRQSCDDFAAAAAMSCVCLWYTSGTWPSGFKN